MRIRYETTLGLWATVRAMVQQAAENLKHRATEGYEPEIPRWTIRRLAKLPVVRAKS